jgi:hypothetical protein
MFEREFSEKNKLHEGNFLLINFMNVPNALQSINIMFTSSVI